MMCGLGSSVGIATGCRLDGPGIESWWGRDFTRLSRLAHLASCTRGTGSFPGVKSSWGMSTYEFWLKSYRSNKHCTLGPLYVFDLSPLLAFELETLLVHTKRVQFACPHA